MQLSMVLAMQLPLDAALTVLAMQLLDATERDRPPCSRRLGARSAAPGRPPTSNGERPSPIPAAIAGIGCRRAVEAIPIPVDDILGEQPLHGTRVFQQCLLGVEVGLELLSKVC